MLKSHTLVLDVGTSSVKAFVFDDAFRVLVKASASLSLSTRGKRVEQDPAEILKQSIRVLREAVQSCGVPLQSLTSFGLTNQRETTILWDANTGKPVYPAIVWQDTRTEVACAPLRRKYGRMVREKTGLPIDPYFSASKIAWILSHVKSASELLSKGRLLFGTVDSWLLWNLLEGHPHLTDWTNASRTLLFDVKTMAWDRSLCELFSVPFSVLPLPIPSRSAFGYLDSRIVGARIPVGAVCGDQHASLYAAGTRTGATKVTYGTGTFVTQVLGTKFTLHNGFFTTLVPTSGARRYALEAKVGKSGAEVARLLPHPARLQLFLRELAKKTNTNLRKLPRVPTSIRVDGGITQSDFLLAEQARISGMRVVRQKTFDGTALGIAMLLASS